MKNIIDTKNIMKAFSRTEAHNFIIPSILFPAFLLKGFVSFPSYVSWRYKLEERVSWVCIFLCSLVKLQSNLPL